MDQTDNCGQIAPRSGIWQYFPPVEIYPSKAMSLLLSVISLAFIPLIIHICILEPFDVPKYLRIFTNQVFWLGLAGILLFGVGAVFFLLDFISQRPALIIDDCGLVINDRLFWMPRGRVLWSEISDVTLNKFSYKGNTCWFIMVMLHDPQGYIDRMPNRWARSWAKKNFKLGGSPISLSTINLDISLKELLDLLQAYLQNSRRA